ncbi:MAG: PAS domain S-box protein, partial [Acidobacteriota bacterium]
MRAPSFVWMITAGCVLVTLLAVNSYLTFINTSQLNNDAGWVEHSYQVVNGLDRVISIATEIESAGRGYILTGDEQFREQYSTRLNTVDAQIGEIEKLTADNPEQHARIPELRQRANERMQILTEAVEARRTGGMEAVRPLMGNGRGKIAMDKLLETVGKMEDSERGLLDQRAQRSIQTYWTAIVTEIGAGLVAIAAVLGFLVLLRRFLRARTEAAFVIAEQAERLRTTLASIGDAVITTDTEGGITNMNAVAESLTGWTTIEASGRPLEDVFRIVNEATRDVVENPVVKSLRDGSIVGLANHTVLLTKDGRELPIDDSAAPIRCEEGEIVGCVLVFRDVSDRRREEARTREMHSRLASTLAFGEIGTWEFDLLNNLVVADPNLARIFHLKEGEEGGTRLENLLRSIHPEDIGTVESTIQKAVDNGDRYDLEYRIVGEDNRFRWVMGRGRVERDEQGRAVRLPGVVIDITRSRQAEEDVERLVSVSERERRLFNTALSNTADFIYTFDLEGRFTYINQALLSLLQKMSADAVGKNFFELDYPPELAEKLQSQIQQVIDTGKPVKDETPYTSHKGERQYEYIFVPVFGLGGAVEAVAGSTRDITDRKETEVGLRESEKRLRQLADAMPQIVWTAKPNGTLDYYNWRWYEYVGLSPERIEEARWDIYIHPNDLPRAYEKWTESLATGEPYGIEFRVKNHEGNYRWFLTRALPVRNDSGMIVRWYGSCTDIHEEVERENELRNVAARLSDADRRKNEFLAMLAHELRNPLAPIRNALQIIRLTSSQSGDLHSATTMMDRQVGQLVRLVDDLLDISR